MGDEHARGKERETGDGMHGQGIIIAHAHGAVTASRLARWVGRYRARARIRWMDGMDHGKKGGLRNDEGVQSRAPLLERRHEVALRPLIG